MVDIVIVNWNSGALLQTCVNSILTKKNYSFLGAIFIIDNNSTDNSMMLLSVDPKIKIILNNTNLGFSKACNQGFKLCEASYTLLLNPDAQLQENTLQECISFLEENPTIDILGCMLLNDEGKITHSCARFPTPLSFLSNSIGLPKIFPSVFKPTLLMADWDHKTNREVDQVMGAFMFMPTLLFSKVGYFDEQFFVYYEELDFSKRVKEAGGLIYFNSKIKAIHSGGGSTSQVKDYRLFLNLRSRLQYAKKHFSYSGNFLVGIATIFVEPVTRIFYLLVQGKLSEIKSTLKGYKMLLDK